MPQVVQVNISEGDLIYCVRTDNDDLVEHQIGNVHWTEAPTFSNHDLFDCRNSLMTALQKVEDEMEERRLIGRIT